MKLYQFALSLLLLSCVNFVDAMSLPNNSPTAVSDVKRFSVGKKETKQLVNKKGAIISHECYQCNGKYIPYEYEEFTIVTSPLNSHNRKVLPLVVCSQSMADASHIVGRGKKYESSQLKVGFATVPCFGPCSDPNCQLRK